VVERPSISADGLLIQRPPMAADAGASLAARASIAADAEHAPVQRPRIADEGRPAQGRPARPGGRAAAAGGGSSAWDGPAEEPPYDPEYDGAEYPGFDPGDEPLDDDEEAGPRESSEEVAVRLLTEALGAERIKE
jgi:DNA polymerase-3 subunit gamma/tau